MLRAEVVERLRTAARALAEQGTGLLVWDGWRPLALQRWLWDEYRSRLAKTTGLEGDELDARAKEFVSPVTEEGPPPAHATGGAVDLTLCSVDGEALEMGGGFDELSERSHPDYYEHSGLDAGAAAVRERRRLLAAAMKEVGFERLATEWWHFEYGTPNWARWTGGRPLFGPIGGMGEG